MRNVLDIHIDSRVQVTEGQNQNYYKVVTKWEDIRNGIQTGSSVIFNSCNLKMGGSG